ncbi:DUF3267 domain-containing protein [Enterococcus sp. LJL128]|uniref:DUF3267 domain-containing protein n=1 Tax=Enterococcus sp. LJL51 TaxID=3416656 RepID=UPI003CF99CF1
MKQDNDAPQHFYQLCKEMTAQGYRIKERVFTGLEVNVLGLLLPAPLIIGLFFLYRSLNTQPLKETADINYLLLLLILVSSIVVHEYIHGFGWGLFCQNKWHSIKITFGFPNPLCHCKESLSWKNYVFGALLPIIVLGGGCTLLLLLFPGNYTFLAAALNVLLAGGDLMIVLYSLKSRHTQIYDHPTKPGFILFERNY